MKAQQRQFFVWVVLDYCSLEALDTNVSIVLASTTSKYLILATHIPNYIGGAFQHSVGDKSQSSKIPLWADPAPVATSAVPLSASTFGAGRNKGGRGGGTAHYALVAT